MSKECGHCSTCLGLTDNGECLRMFRGTTPGGIPHNGRGPASPTDGMSWEEFCELRDEKARAHWEANCDALRKAAACDTVNPSHYIGHNGIECHQVQRAVLGQAGMGAYWHGCALKYLFRAIKKNGAEDIRKAIRCLQFWLDEVTPSGSKE